MMHHKNILTISLLLLVFLFAAGCTTFSQNNKPEEEINMEQPLKLCSENPIYTEKDISDAKAVVEKYFDARNQKDAQKIVECYHPDKLTLDDVEKGVILFEQEEITLVKIHEYDAEFQKSFMPSALDKFPENNILVFKVDYEVTFPNGGAENSPYNEGMYDNWAVILVRDSLGFDWLIYGQGY